MRCAALLFAVAACAASQPSAVAQSPPPPPAPAPAPALLPSATPHPELEDVMMHVNEFTEKMCRCADQACTQQVMSDITAWGTAWQEQHKNFKLTEEENKVIQDTATKLMECMQRAGSNAPSP
jgi:hypothetical protein